MTAPQPPIRVAIPVGDPNGIGPEIALRTVAAYGGRSDLELTLFGPGVAIERAAQSLDLIRVLETARLIPTAALSESAHRPGQVNAQAGFAAVDAATQAILAAQRGEIDTIVAAPHHEGSIAKAGIRFSGYPSLVAHVCRQPEDSVFLLLIGGGLRIVHVTLHESVQSALQRLSPALVADASRAGARALLRLGVLRPRIGLMGINPHAGEDGLFGREDEAITQVAAAQLRAQGFDVTGPSGADTLLASRAHDLYVAIFHDQGHIPIKLISPRRASAPSIGTDVILSSVGHGSAMDIAGKGIASAGAMIETVALVANVPLPTAERSA